MADFVDLVKLAVPMIGAAGGAAWAGVKVALNGTQKQIAQVSKKVDDRCNKIEQSVDDLLVQVTDARIDIGRLEGQIGEVRNNQSRRKRTK